MKKKLLLINMKFHPVQLIIASYQEHLACDRDCFKYERTLLSSSILFQN